MTHSGIPLCAMVLGLTLTTQACTSCVDTSQQGTSPWSVDDPVEDHDTAEHPMSPPLALEATSWESYDHSAALCGDNKTQWRFELNAQLVRDDARMSLSGEECNWTHRQVQGDFDIAQDNLLTITLSDQRSYQWQVAHLTHIPTLQDSGAFTLSSTELLTTHALYRSQERDTLYTLSHTASQPFNMASTQLRTTHRIELSSPSGDPLTEGPCTLSIAIEAYRAGEQIEPAPEESLASWRGACRITDTGLSGWRAILLDSPPPARDPEIETPAQRALHAYFSRAPDLLLFEASSPQRLLPPYRGSVYSDGKWLRRAQDSF